MTESNTRFQKFSAFVRRIEDAFDYDPVFELHRRIQRLEAEANKCRASHAPPTDIDGRAQETCNV